MRIWGLLFLCFVCVAVAGCDRYRMVKARFANEYQCREELKVSNLGGGAVRVQGCGHKASYVCAGNTCAREYTRDDLENRGEWYGPPSRPRKDNAWSQVRSGRTKDGARALSVKIASQKMALYLHTVPGKDNGMVSVGLQILNKVMAHKDCSLRLMVDGRLLELGETGYRYEQGMEEFRTAMSYDDLFALADGTRVLGRVCDDEFRVGDERLQTVRELVMRIREELSWQESQPEEEPATGTEAAPDGGAVEPAAAEGEVL